MNLRSISIRSRLSLLVISALLLLAAVAFYTALMQREQMLQDRKAKILNIVDIAHALVAHHASQVTSGKLSLAEAQEQARLSLRSIRYDGDNYLAVLDTEHNVVEHPLMSRTISTVPKMAGQMPPAVLDSRGSSETNSHRRAA